MPADRHEEIAAIRLYRKAFWLRLALATGFVLGLLLLVRTLLTYNYVAGQLLMDHLEQRAGDYITQVQNLVRAEEPEDEAGLSVILDSFRLDSADEIAWIGIYDRPGGSIAISGPIADSSLDRSTLDEILMTGELSVKENRIENKERLLIVTTPFRFRFFSERGEQAGGQGVPGLPRFRIARIALYLRGMTEAYAPLRRNLAISIAASAALLLSITVVILRLNSYLRGRELEQQLELATLVQEGLLPTEFPKPSTLEISTVFRPAYGIAGDYYDIFDPGDERISISLGDVSGKGIPAALIMASLHSSIRSMSLDMSPGDTAIRLHQLNRDLFERTPTDHFVTLIWAIYNPATALLEYVNAGHPAPILVRRSTSVADRVERLDQGGPILGGLPESEYRQSTVRLEPGDLLLFYSDGLDEASDRDGKMYGEERVIEVLLSVSGEPVDAIRDTILHDVVSFTGGSRLQDDLTLLVVRSV